MILWLGFTPAAHATHFRYGSLTWKPTTGRTIQFKLSLSYRTGFFPQNYNFTPTVGAVSPAGVPVNFAFGDGVTTTKAASFTVTSVNTAGDYFFAEAVFTHTYSGTATSFTAGHYDSDRLSTPLVNNHDQPYGITTLVNVGTGNSSPVSSLVPIVNLAAGISNATFLVPASDPNGNPLSFSLATPADLRLTAAQFVQPMGLTITPSGQVTFNTVGKTVGQFYNAVVKISDGTSFIVVDFLIQLVANTGNPPVFVYGGITPANGSTIQGVVGTPISFTVKANDTDPGSTVDLSASGLPVGSSFPPTSGTGTASSVFSYTPTGAGNSVITFSAIDNIGKQTLTSVNLQICSPINPTVIASNMGTLTCANPSLTLTAGGGSFYVFLGPNLNQSSTTNTAKITQAGTFTVTVSGGNSCPTSVTTAVVSNTVTPQDVTLSASSTLTCAQTSVRLTAGSSTMGTSYTFSGTGITSQSSNTATINQPGTYTVVATGTNGCVASTTTSVTSDTALPSVSISPSAVTICVGQSTTLTAAGGVSYKWSTADITASISVTSAGPYSVTATGANGCSNTATASVTVTPLPNASFTGLPASVCVDAAPFSLSATTPGGSFSGPGIGGNLFNPGSATAGGPYSISYTVSSLGCSNTSSQSITVNALPTPAINSLNAAYCRDAQPVSLTGTPGGGTFTIDGVTAILFTPTSLTVGQHTVVYSYTNANGCSATTSQSVAINALPTVGIMPSSATVCAGQSTTLTALGADTYKWTTGATTASISVTAAGPYSVTGTSTSTGCSNTATASVTVNALPTSFSVTGGGAYCAGGSGVQVGLSGSQTGVSYQLMRGNTSVGIPLAGTGAALTFPSQTTAGTYTVLATNTTTSCSQLMSGSAVVSINPPPTATITPSATAVCAGQSATFTATPGLSTYSWNTGAITSTISVSVAGPYSVTVTDINGCSATAGASLTVNALPTLAITPGSATICAGQSTTLAATSGLIYQWSTAQTTPSISVSVAGPYSVTGTDPTTGCSNTATAILTVTPLPTASFTGLPASVCVDAGPSSLTPATPGGSFAGPGISESLFNPAIAGAGGPYSITYTVSSMGCSTTSVQLVTVKPLPVPPTITTQAGHPYPTGQSNVTVSQNTGIVILMVGGCAGGTITWSGGNATTLAVSTLSTGVQTFTATCTSNGCVSPVGTATVNVVPTTLSVLHRDATNGQLNTNTLNPYLELQNDGNMAIPYSEITVRYFLTVENPAPLQFQINYAQLGSDKVHLKYVPAATGNPAATGYIEFSFDASAGSLGAGQNSGPIQDIINKQDFSFFNQADDYSYVNVGNYTPNPHITAYRNGVLFYGIEPGPITPMQSVRAMLQNNTGADANSIEAVLSVTNDGNVPINYGDLKVRYYFTADNTQPLVLNQIGYTALGSANVSAQLVTISPALAGADRYLELSFSPSLGQLAPGASTGGVTYQIRHADYSGFNQNNDYSYQGTGGTMVNPHVVVFVAGQRAYGTEPGTGGRLSAEGIEIPLRVQVLGNPVRSSAVEVIVNGADGSPLTFTLTDLSGRTVTTRQVERAGASEAQRLEMGGTSAGMLLLRVSTPSQSQTVKVMKVE